MMYDQNQYIEIIIDKLTTAFRGQWDFLLAIGKRLTAIAEAEKRFNKIHLEQETSNHDNEQP